MDTESRESYKNRKSQEKIALIGGVCLIISAIIGTFSINVNIENDKLKKEYEEVISENTDLNNQSTESQKAYDALNSQYEDLVSKNNDLQVRLSSLESELSQYSSISEENVVLKSELENLQSEVNNLKNKYENQEKSNLSEQNDIAEQTDPIQPTSKKVSIFDLDTFKGNPGWYNHSDYSNKDVFIDTYGTEYLTGYMGHHLKGDKNSSHSPTYLLDNNYSTCEGEIAWAKNDKNSKETAWIEFYSGDELIYRTDAITVDSRPFSFSFNVEGIEKLTIVRNATGSNSSWIIYPYLNLIE